MGISPFIEVSFLNASRLDVAVLAVLSLDERIYGVDGVHNNGFHFIGAISISSLESILRVASGSTWALIFSLSAPGSKEEMA
ncbi:hypothetical protein VNO78_21510 [Psophocarpus tetragonolobus]|uniref:Uncharacterized protein n=1 Tax=Psophocarpus tetragonolobus TaxID=3891 RepID=A0AAN9SB76_PSOTE